jgi:hypothetical protein
VGVFSQTVERQPTVIGNRAMSMIVSRRSLVLVSVALVLLFGATCAVWRVWYGDFRTGRESVQATMEAEAFLTETYGAEVSWDYTPDWLKEIIGELPDEPDPCGWFDEWSPASTAPPEYR